MSKKVKTSKDRLVKWVFFPFPLWIDKGKPINAWTGCLLISLKRPFQLMNNKVIMHALENIPCFVEDFYGQTQPVQHVLPSWFQMWLYQVWKRLSVHAPPESVIFKSFRPNDIFFEGMMSYFDVTWRPRHGQGFAPCPSNQRKISWIARKSYFLTWWPWPLTLTI